MHAIGLASLDAWDMALLVAAAYVALTSLVRLMQMRRDQLVDRLQQQLEEEQRRKKQATKRKPSGRPGEAA